MCNAWALNESLALRGVFRMVLVVENSNTAEPTVADEGPFDEVLADDIDTAADETELVRELILATYRHDRDARGQCTIELDRLMWGEGALLLAAAKQVLLEREQHAIETAGVESWLKVTAVAITRRHADWMRLVPGQIITMLRSGLGQHELAVMVTRSVRARLDATIVEHLLAAGLGRRDVFVEELDDLLREAGLIASRPVFIHEFAEDRAI